MACTEDARKQFRNEAVADQIIASIADQMQTDPLDLPPLTRTVDVDALGALVEGSAVSEITFAYHGHQIVIYGDGQVDVTIDEQRR